MIKSYSEIPGWCDYEDLYKEFALRLANNSVFVELGVWQGRSICFLGEQVRSLGKIPNIFAVDTFEGSENEAFHKQVVGELGGSLLSVFEQNLSDLKLSDLINILPYESIFAAHTFEDESIDIAFVDANHAYEFVLRDLDFWYPKVKKGGIFSGHDYVHNGVGMAVREFVAKNHLELVNKSFSCWSVVKPF